MAVGTIRNAGNGAGRESGFGPDIVADPGQRGKIVQKLKAELTVQIALDFGYRRAGDRASIGAGAGEACRVPAPIRAGIKPQGRLRKTCASPALRIGGVRCPADALLDGREDIEAAQPQSDRCEGRRVGGSAEALDGALAAAFGARPAQLVHLEAFERLGTDRPGGDVVIRRGSRARPARRLGRRFAQPLALAFTGQRGRRAGLHRVGEDIFLAAKNAGGGGLRPRRRGRRRLRVRRVGGGLFGRQPAGQELTLKVDLGNGAAQARRLLGDGGGGRVDEQRGAGDEHRCRDTEARTPDPCRRHSHYRLIIRTPEKRLPKCKRRWLTER